MRINKMRTLKEFITQELELPLLLSEDTTEESGKKKLKLLFDDSEEDFGSPRHVEDMQSALASLIRLRETFPRGSAKRVILANCIRLLKDLVAKHDLSQETLPQDSLV